MRMAINVAEKVDLAALERILSARGWREGRFNGERVLLKDQGEWIWIARLGEEGVSFLSLPSEERSDLHSRGVRLLLKEVEEVGRYAGFSPPVRV